MRRTPLRTQISVLQPVSLLDKNICRSRFAGRKGSAQLFRGKESFAAGEIARSSASQVWISQPRPPSSLVPSLLSPHGSSTGRQHPWDFWQGRMVCMLRLYLAVLLARRHGRMALHGAPCSGSPPLPSPPLHSHLLPFPCSPWLSRCTRHLLADNCVVRAECSRPSWSGLRLSPCEVPVIPCCVDYGCCDFWLWLGRT